MINAIVYSDILSVYLVSLFCSKIPFRKKKKKKIPFRRPHYI